MRHRDHIGFVIASVIVACAAEAGAQCRVDGDVIRVPRLSEASGITASRRVPDRLWAINDSGEPVIYALSSKGMVAGEIRLTGAKVEDWEAVAVGPCPDGSCLYVGDIGDNGARRARITIYRVPEPADANGGSARSDVFFATYPDGPQDAEAMLTGPDGRLYVVTKGETGAVALYRFPRELEPGSSVQLERVGKPRGTTASTRRDRITDAAASPDGNWIVLRTSRALTFHRAKELIAGNWKPAQVVDLAQLHEPQGEGVTFAADNSIVVAGEGGGKSAAGTLARLSCTSLR